ncbi:MAG: maleylacetoacetate isomerase [Magnetospirillum sp.]|nr:maleylacetoacetate isomerase [Magnetospirillum sp.]
MQLYNFFLRIALNLKGLSYDYIPVDLRTEEHLGAPFKALNPQGLVPALVEDGMVLIQSPSIIEWLEERYPSPPLLPADSEGRARVRALAALVGCDIHPINNRRILEYLRKVLGCDEAAVQAWCVHWITAGFDGLEALLAADPARGAFCYGQTPTIADLYLVPQVESARRFKVDLEPYPIITAIDAACGELDGFRRAAPALQPDV